MDARALSRRRLGIAAGVLLAASLAGFGVRESIRVWQLRQELSALEDLEVLVQTPDAHRLADAEDGQADGDEEREHHAETLTLLRCAAPRGDGWAHRATRV